MKLCSFCKIPMMADVSRVYTSNPPKYLYRCPRCGKMEFDSCSEAFDNHQEAYSYVVRTKQAVAVGFLIGIITFLGIKKNINLEEVVRHCEKILENHPEYGLSPKEKVKLIGMVQHLAMFIKEFSDEEIPVQSNKNHES